MALSPNGESCVGGSQSELPIFKVERVQLQFTLSADFVGAAVANNVLILSLATGRILRIDLDNPADIDGMQDTNFLSRISADIRQTSIYQRKLPRLV